MSICLYLLFHTAVILWLFVPGEFTVLQLSCCQVGDNHGVTTLRATDPTYKVCCARTPAGYWPCGSALCQADTARAVCQSREEDPVISVLSNLFASSCGVRCFMTDPCHTYKKWVVRNNPFLPFTGQWRPPPVIHAIQTWQRRRLHPPALRPTLRWEALGAPRFVCVWGDKFSAPACC